MKIFKTRREKKIWFYIGLIIAGIYSSLFLGRPLADLLKNQDVQALFFVIGMALIAGCLIFFSIRGTRTKTELGILVGFVAVYLMLFLRLGLAERTHLIEYSVLGIFVYHALLERNKSKASIWLTGFIACSLAVVVGILDEILQIFIPDRVFDPIDIVFNTCAVLGAVVMGTTLEWFRARSLKS